MNSHRSDPASARPATAVAAVDDRGLDRRGFLRLTAVAGGGLMLGFYANPSFAADAATVLPAAAAGGAGDFSPNAFVRIAADGTVTISAHKTEMGQGIITSLPMIIAEELDADWKSVRIDSGRHSSSFPGQATAGSSSTPSSYGMMRQLGGTARAVLVEAAAQAWGVPAAECTTAAGVVTHATSGRKAGYGELVAKATTLPVPAANTVQLKDPKDFKILGTRVGGYRNPDIVVGKPLFGIDQKTPGMLHAVYVKCPVFGGKPVSANLDKIRTLPGVKQAFLLEGKPNLLGVLPTIQLGLEPGVAIVADSTWAAISARKQLEVSWDEGRFATDSTASFARQAAEIGAKPDGMTVARNDGAAAAALAGAAKVVEAAYSYPFISHANMEPQNTLAHVQGDRAEIWSPTQNPDAAARSVAALLGVPVGNIKVNIARMGTGMGRRYMPDFAIEAAAISKQAGAPIRLQWSREDDMQHDYYRPGGYHFLKGGLDASGKLVAWQNHFVTFGAMAAGRGGGAPTLTPGDGANLGGGLFPARFVPNYHSVQTVLETNIPIGPWRNPGNNAFGFVMEGFVDEMANAAGKDPLQFRLDLLATTPVPNPAPPAGARGGFPGFGGGGLNVDRVRDVLQLAAEKAGWGKKFVRGQGAGIASFSSMQGFAAFVVEVSVSRTGTLKVDRVVGAIDVGRQIVNLSGAEAQVQGSIIDALSAAWNQELALERGHIVQGNFADFPLLRITEAPARIEIHFLKSDNNPSGLGEIAVPPLAPAVVNAIFAATGKRIRTLPIAKNDLSWS